MEIEHTDGSRSDLFVWRFGDSANRLPRCVGIEYTTPASLLEALLR